LGLRIANPVACFEAYNEQDDIEEYFERLELFLRYIALQLERK